MVTYRDERDRPGPPIAERLRALAQHHRALAELLETEAQQAEDFAPPALRAIPATEADRPASPSAWREKLWVVPAETRIGVAELCEAVGRSRRWVYRHTAQAAERPLPSRKLDGELVFVVGEIRTWLREHEEVILAGPMESTLAERRASRVGIR